MKLFSNIFFLGIFLGFSVFSNPILAAEPISAVASNNCQALKNTQAPFIIVLAKGEKMPDAILQCVEAADISGASLSGLGALQDPVLEYFSLKDKKYQDKKFNGVYELASLNGNVSLSDNKPFAHLHVVLGDKNYKTIAGHLKEGLVGATAEVTVVPLENKLVRVPDEAVGLNLISTQQNKK